MFALADCNNFFVSCERVFRPDLEGRAVVVLSNNDGCAISRSNEAKALGVKMGQPFFEFEPLVRSGRVTVFSCNFPLYGDFSHRVHQTLRTFVPAIEIYSIDEAFLDLSGMEGEELDALAKRISRTCHRNTGIPVSVGIAPTKTLAKIASHLCKTHPKLLGGCYMHRPCDIEKVLRKTEIGEVWGIGRKFTAKLALYGIHTAYDFTQCEATWVRALMGIGGLRTWQELRGTPSIDFLSGTPAKQQICVSRSFAKEITAVDDLVRQVSLFATMATEKLRKQHSVCQQAQVFIYTNRHRESAPQAYESQLVTFAVATDSTLEINKAVLLALRQMYRGGFGYKKAGVILSSISSKSTMQSVLFDAVDHPKHTKLMEIVDAINAKAGHSTIALASQSTEGVRMNRDHLSPQYTTLWSDIITVKTEQKPEQK
ncbi:MAG: Y-family DNA polymerase [Alistipes sp.]